jgi:hypothetical protein
VINGMGQEFPCAGNQISEDARKALSKIKTNSKIFIDNIKVLAPDGPRDFPIMKIMVK